VVVVRSDNNIGGREIGNPAFPPSRSHGSSAFRLTDRLSERERAMLMGGACAKAYGWAPKKS
jgi:hypothetical protein